MGDEAFVWTIHDAADFKESINSGVGSKSLHASGINPAPVPLKKLR
jgi:hypothetical protein